MNKQRSMISVAAVGLTAGLGYWFLKDGSPEVEKETSKVSPGPRSSDRDSGEVIFRNRDTEVVVRSKHPDNSIEAKIATLWELRKYDEAATRFEGWLKNDPEGALDYVGAMTAPMVPSHFGPAIAAR